MLLLKEIHAEVASIKADISAYRPPLQSHAMRRRLCSAAAFLSTSGISMWQRIMQTFATNQTDLKISSPDSSSDSLEDVLEAYIRISSQ